MILYIDTTDGENILVILAQNDQIIAQKKAKAKYKQSEKLLGIIDKLMSKPRIVFTNTKAVIRGKVQRTLDLSSLKGVVVVNGPGLFTATRIGVSTANALAYALKIPVVGIKKDEFSDVDELVAKGSKKISKKKDLASVMPFYDKEPNVTKPKK